MIYIDEVKNHKEIVYQNTITKSSLLVGIY